MGITWGAKFDHWWVGLDHSVSVGADSVTITWRVVFAIEQSWSISARGYVSWSGAASGSAQPWLSGTGYREVTVQSVTTRHARTYSNQNVSLTASLREGWHNSSGSVTRSVTIPAKSYNPPYAPTSVTAVRNTDTSVTVSWAQSAPADRPVSSFGIARKSLRDPVWRQVASGVSGSARSWTDTTTSGGDVYTYRMNAQGPGGSSATPESNSVATTPAAPTGVAAVKQNDGSILVTWSAPSPFYGDSFSVYDNGVRIASGVSSSVREWTHSRPDPSVTHTYTLTQTASGLESGKSSPSGTVQLLTRPNPPTLTSPSGSVLAGSVLLAWRHNSVDTTAQTRAEVRYRVGGAPSWTTLTITGAAQTRAITAAAGRTYEWQVRTQGAYQQGRVGGWSGWSPVGSFNAVSAPTVVINAPGSQVTTSRVTVGWGYSQAQGHAQASATVELVELGPSSSGGGLGVTTIEKKTVQGSASSLTLATTLEDGGAYRVRVTVRSSDGLTSTPAETDFRVKYPKPPAPVLEVTWDDTLGAALVAINNRAATTSETDTDHNTVYRSIDGGQTWEQVAEGVPPNTVVSDPEALSYGTTLYKAEATTTLPSSATSTTVELTAASQAVWLSGITTTSASAPLRYDIEVSHAPALLHREVHHFAGRVMGVELSGIQRARRITITATLTDTDPALAAVQELACAPGPVVYRDPQGRRIWVSVSSVEVSRSPGGLWRVRVSAEEVERGESDLA